MNPDPAARHVAVLFNRDYHPGQADFAARADVERTAHAIAAGLATHPGVRTTLVAAEDDPLVALAEIRAHAPDVVFNLCETLRGDAESECVIPAVLDMYGIRYTGSPALTLATAVRKDRTKALLRAQGVPTPPAVVVNAPLKRAPDFGFPMICKPVSEDGSLGISAASVVHTLRALNTQITVLTDTYAQPVLVEKYISGREINVPLLEGQILPWSEIDFTGMPKGLPPIITYIGKWDEESEEYRGSVPRLAPRFAPKVRASIAQAAAGAFTALECRGYARVDLRVDAEGQPYVIDINPNCDLSAQGGFFKAVRAARLSYADMVLHIAQLALGAPLVIPHPSHSLDVHPRLGAAPRLSGSLGRLHT